ncbi:MAG: 6-carboxytetrahydropterin synthase [Pseudomonadota bacterium]
MFEVIVKKKIKAAHALLNYQGGEEASHFHDWLIEVKLRSKQLDQAGCAIDFAVVDKVLDEILISIKDKALNQLVCFENISPSAENFAKYVYDKIGAALVLEQTSLMSVGVWEDEEHGVTYCE